MSGAASQKAIAAGISRSAIAGNLQLARTIFNLSQEDLGNRCQLHRTHISAIERQELNVGVDTIERIAKAFAVPAYVLLMSRAEAQPLLYQAFLANSVQPG
jgi:transcriptional regulator with XRE-family HTH domain